MRTIIVAFDSLSATFWCAINEYGFNCILTKNIWAILLICPLAFIPSKHIYLWCYVCFCAVLCLLCYPKIVRLRILYRIVQIDIYNIHIDKLGVCIECAIFNALNTPPSKTLARQFVYSTPRMDNTIRITQIGVWRDLGGDGSHDKNTAAAPHLKKGSSQNKIHT